LHRLAAAGAEAVALAAHPGLTRTHLGRYLSAVTRAFYVEASTQARDTGAQRRLWQKSERLTEVSYAI